MKILFLTKYEYLGASSRYRTLQYLPYVKETGFEFDVLPLFNDKYLEYKYTYGKANILIALGRLLKRIKTVLLDSYKYDLLVIEKELVPYFPPVFEYYLKLIKKPYILDYDDAVWHNYDSHRKWWVRKLLGNKIKYVMKNAQIVIGGSKYIIDYAKKARAKKVVKIPTSIDLEKYKCNNNEKRNKFIIGWIGSPATSKYILSLNNVLADFTKNYDSIVHLIGFDKKLEDKLLFNFKIIDWSEKTEVQKIYKFDVGIMPLTDSPFERGKCGFKLIQYMGCKKPVIASPIGENKIIVEHGINGYLAKSETEWLEFLTLLYNAKDLRDKLGESGYEKVKKQYSLEENKNKYLHTISNFIWKANENSLS